MPEFKEQMPFSKRKSQIRKRAHWHRAGYAFLNLPVLPVGVLKTTGLLEGLGSGQSLWDFGTGASAKTTNLSK